MWPAVSPHRQQDSNVIGASAKIVNGAQFYSKTLSTIFFLLWNGLRQSELCILFCVCRHCIRFIIAYVTFQNPFQFQLDTLCFRIHPFRTLFIEMIERMWDFLIAYVFGCRVWRWHIVSTRCGWQFEINFLSLNRIRIQFACVYLYMYVRMQYVPKSIFSLCIYRILFPFDCVAPFHGYDMCSIARVNYLKCRTHIRHFN